MTRFLLVAALVTLCQQAFAQSNVRYTNCGTEGDILTLDDIYFEPEYIKSGDQVTIDVTGSLSQDITKGAKVKVDLNYFGQSYYSNTFDYCDFVNNRDDIDYDIKCPVSEGPLEVSQVVTIPNNIPKGVYTLRLTATTESGDPVGCAELVANFEE